MRCRWFLVPASFLVSTCLSFSNAAPCPGHEFAKIVASDGDESHRFGYAVAVSGDTALVGAYRDEENGTDSGSVYVLRFEDDHWIEAAKLTASDGHGDDEFGFSVALSGDTAVVGAHEDGGPADAKSGSAYVFIKPVGGWADMTETAKLTASDKGANDHLGHAVAIDGDTIVVGAEGDNVGSGSAYVFARPVAGWITMTETAKLTATDGANFAQFGASVAVAGDTVFVGADGHSDSRGAVYVFERPADGWVDATEDAKLTQTAPISRDFFGYSIAVAGDTAIVGAYMDDSQASDAGAAYVFEKPPAGWVDMTQTVKLTASDGVDRDYFGSAVALDGRTAIVGATDEDDEASGAGAVYVFTFDGTSWTEQAKLTASDGARFDNFGVAVGISGDRAVIGADQDDDLGGYSGAVYTFAGMASNCDGDPMMDVCTGDCNGNGTADGCEVFAGTAQDCNENGVLDECDLRDGTSVDINENDVPDDCEDCNHNDVLDEDDIAGGISGDCNANGLPDECELVFVQSNPPTGAVDARQPDDSNGIPARAGWAEIDITPGPCLVTLSPDDFTVTVSGGDGEALAVQQIQPIGADAVRLTLNGPLGPETWTMLTHDLSGASICLGVLPGDTSQDGQALGADLGPLIDCINGDPVPSCALWRTDINRSGSANARDFLRMIDVLNGAGDLDPWLGVSIGPSPCTSRRPR